MPSFFNKHWLLLGLFLFAVLVISTLFIVSTTKTEGASAKEWPAFEMVYTDWAAHSGPNNSSSTIRIRLTYQNARNWRSEVLEDSVVPQSVGSYSEFKGAELTGYDAQFKTRSATNLPDGLYAPADWLFPERVDSLQNRHGGNLIESLTDGNLEYSYTEQVTCDETVNQCKTSSSQVITLYRLQKETQIPINMTVTSDGEITHRITADTLQLLH